MHRHVGVLGAAVADLLIAGCGHAAAPAAEEMPAVDSTLAPDESTASGQPSADVVLMEVSSKVAAAGSRVELYFPADTLRGIAFYLDERVGGAWEREFTLVAAIGPGGPTWAPQDEEVAVDDIGTVGPGPDEVALPPELAPGSFRICTANAAEEFCAPFYVA